MILISHRGNINGKQLDLENNPSYIDAALNLNYEVEIDIWRIGNIFSLGHDQPQYEITYNWVLDRFDKLWVHCKNLSAIEFFVESKSKLNYFWHQEDEVTLTSHGYIWAYSGKQPIKNSIAVIPEIYNDDITQCKGICSDYIKNYKK